MIFFRKTFLLFIILGLNVSLSAQDFVKLYKSAKEYEKSGSYYTAFDAYRKAMLCSKVPKTSDAESCARFCYAKFREQQKSTNLLTAYEFFGMVKNNRAKVYNNDRYYIADSIGNIISSKSFDNLSFTNTNVALFVENDKWGVVDFDGNVLLQPLFDYVIPQSKNVFLFSRSDFIAESGKLLKIDYLYDGFTRLPHNLMIVRDGVLYGLYNINGRKILDIIYNNLEWADNKNWLIATKMNKTALIDTNGTEILPYYNQAIKTFEDGFAWVRVEKGKRSLKGLLNNRGEKALPFRFKEVDMPIEGFCKVKTFSDKYAFYDTSGNKLCGGFENAYGFKNGLALVESKGKQSFVNKQGKVLLPFIYNEVKYYSKGLFLVKDQLWGLCDTLGTIVLPVDCQEIQELDNGTAIFKEKTRYGFIDSLGNVFIKPQYMKVQAFSENLATVQKQSMWSYINKNGVQAFDGKFKSAGKFKKGLAIVQSGKGYGVIDSTGKVIIEAKNFSISIDYSDKLIYVYDSLGYFGVFNLFGKHTNFPEWKNNKTKPASRVYDDIRYNAASDTLIPCSLLDTLFLLGTHLITYNEFISTDLETIKSWSDSLTFFSTLQYAALCEHNRTRRFVLEEKSTSYGGYNKEKPVMLRINKNACVAAQNHSNNMSANDFFDHNDPQGQTPWDRMDAAGCISRGRSAENIFKGGTTLRGAIEGWILSLGHYRNMIGSYQYFGYGYNNYYHTSDFFSNK